jgi:predicted DNA-binding protein (MmcQ/YjbR family)
MSSTRAAQSVRSPDGTRIAFARVGSGPPVIMVEAALHYRDFSSFGGLLPLLSEKLTVYTYDRRGRGESTDTTPYAPEREVEDLAALIAEGGGSAHLYGYSSGALLALHAAAHGLPVNRLALLEPPLQNDDAESPDPLTMELAELVAAGRNSDAVARFHESIGVPSEFLAGMGSTPEWANRGSDARPRQRGQHRQPHRLGGRGRGPAAPGHPPEPGRGVAQRAGRDPGSRPRGVLSRLTRRSPGMRDLSISAGRPFDTKRSTLALRWSRRGVHGLQLRAGNGRQIIRGTAGKLGGVTGDEARATCAGQRGAFETYPFGPHTAVYKVGGKMFALVPRGADPPSVSLKCDPEWSELLRNAYAAVQPGYHLNKRHWNTIILDGSVPDEEVEELIHHSYALVVDTLPQRVQAML